MEDNSDEDECLSDAIENPNKICDLLLDSSGVSKSLVTGDLDTLLSSQIIEEDCSFRIIDVDCDRVLLAMMHPSRVHFYGCVSVVSVAGSFETFGYTVKPGRSPVGIYSLEGSSALYLSTKEDSILPEDFGESYLTKFGIPIMQATKLCHFILDSGCLVLLERVSLPYCLPSEPSHQNQYRFSNRLRPERILGITVERPGNKIPKTLIAPELCFDIENSSARIILCGGTGVGKSTYLRYLVNKALNCHDSVLYLDFDIGQPEFTLPESISAVIVSEPLLGPCYTHFKKPLFSFYVGDNSPTNCIDLYLKAVHSLVNCCVNEPSCKGIPWVVNTMGFSKGIGILLTSTIIQSVQPSILIQIEGKKNQNFPNILDADYIGTVLSDVIKPYTILTVNKLFDTNKKDGISYHTNKEARWLRIQAYFNCVNHSSFPLVCPASKLKVIDLKTKQEIKEEYFKLLTMKIVILSSSENDEFPTILDYGVIMDYEESINSFIVLTPLQPNDKIKSIILGSLQIPSQINKPVSPSTFGFVPHIHVGLTNAPTFKPIKRSYRFLFDVGVQH